MNVSTANRACSFGAINVLAFSQETLGEMRARCTLKENVENKLNMTREEQIRGALNLYAPSSWDFRGEIMPMSKDELKHLMKGLLEAQNGLMIIPNLHGLMLRMICHVIMNKWLECPLRTLN